jgi:two-component system OmpR family response regulator
MKVLMNSIIVVNDEPNILKIVQNLLETEGYGVRAYPHGLEALAAGPADLVITDGSNHPMSGVEFVRQLRRVSDVPVIFLSAWAQELREQLRGTELEAQGYIDLPFSTAELVQRVKLVLQHQAGRES